MAVLANTFARTSTRQTDDMALIPLQRPHNAELIGEPGNSTTARYVAESSTFDMKTLYHLGARAQCGISPVIKLDQGNQPSGAAALGAGFSRCSTPANARDDVDAALRHPPR